MSIQIDRFEVITTDRVDKTKYAIIDHKTDKRIVLLNFEDVERTKTVAEAFKECLEELINNEEIEW